MHIFDDIEFVPDATGIISALMISEGDELEDEIRTMVAKASEVAKPKGYVIEAEVDWLSEEALYIGNKLFTSRALVQNVKDIGRVFPYVATCGTELDDLQKEYNDPLMRYAVDCVKESALRAAISRISDHIKQHFAIQGLSSMNLGSADADVWPIKEQKPLFELLGNVQEKIGVVLTDSCLMIPNKTVSGIFFPSSVEFASCQLCRKQKCPNRRAPFDESLWTATQEK